MCVHNIYRRKISWDESVESNRKENVWWADEVIKVDSTHTHKLYVRHP